MARKAKPLAVEEAVADMDAAMAAWYKAARRAVSLAAKSKKAYIIDVVEKLEDAEWSVEAISEMTSKVILKQFDSAAADRLIRQSQKDEEA